MGRHSFTSGGMNADCSETLVTGTSLFCLWFVITKADIAWAAPPLPLLSPRRNYLSASSESAESRINYGYLCIIFSMCRQLKN
jgi:hypothetical protein